MKEITTGRTRSDAKRKLKILVDDSDFDYINQFNWQVDKSNCVSGRVDKKHILIHRFILQVSDGIEVDHIDGNRLNNQRTNLRIATSSQNKCNRGARKDNKLGLKGVIWNKTRNCFQVHIKIPFGKYLYLGRFADKFKAAKVYNQAALKYHGEFAFLNKV